MSAIENVKGNSNNKYAATLTDVDQTIMDASEKIHEALLNLSRETIDSIKSLQSVSEEILGNLQFLVEGDVNLSLLYDVATEKEKLVEKRVENKLNDVTIEKEELAEEQVEDKLGF